jgi:hypothetical protein
MKEKKKFTSNNGVYHPIDARRPCPIPVHHLSSMSCCVGLAFHHVDVVDLLGGVSCVSDSGLNGILGTFAIKNDGIFLSNRDGACGTSEEVSSDTFKFDIEFVSSSV